MTGGNVSVRFTAYLNFFFNDSKLIIVNVRSVSVYVPKIIHHASLLNSFIGFKPNNRFRSEGVYNWVSHDRMRAYRVDLLLFFVYFVLSIKLSSIIRL